MEQRGLAVFDNITHIILQIARFADDQCGKKRGRANYDQNNRTDIFLSGQSASSLLRYREITQSITSINTFLPGDKLQDKRVWGCRSLLELCSGALRAHRGRRTRMTLNGLPEPDVPVSSVRRRSLWFPALGLPGANHPLKEPALRLPGFPPVDAAWWCLG